MSQETGAASLLAGAGLLVIAFVAALVLDLGRIYRERAALQLQADAAALSAAHDVGTCTANAIDPGASATATAQANGFAGDLASTGGSVEFGEITTSGGLRVFDADTPLARAEAVRVVARREVPRTNVLPPELGGTVELAATSVARARAIASMRAGTNLASGTVDSDTDAPMWNAILGGLIAGPIDISVVGYEGMLDANVSLAELAAAHGTVGDVDALLDAEVTLAGLLALAGSALDAQGNAPVAATLGEFEIAAAQPDPIRIGDLIVVEPGSGAEVPNATVNVFDLVSFAAQLANGSSAITVSPVGVTLPELSEVALRIVILEPARIAIGPPGQDATGDWRTEVQTAQIRAELTLTASTPLTVIESETVRVSAYATIAPTRVHLESIACRRAGEAETIVRVGSESALAEQGVGSYGDIEGSNSTSGSSVAELSLLGVPVASVSASSVYPTTSPAQSLEFAGPFVPWIDEPASEHTQTAGDDAETTLALAVAGLTSDLAIEVDVLGSLPLGVSAGDIETATGGILVPLIGLLPELWAPVFSAVGAQAGGVDVTILSVNTRRPTLLR